MKDKQIILPKKEVESVFSLYKNGHLNDALASIKALNASFPNQPILFNIAGACYQGLGDLNSAVKMFKTVIKISPNYAEAHFNLGVVFQDMDNKYEAIQSYNKAIALMPKYPNAFNNLGNIFLSLGQFEKAIESFEWAIAHQHDHAEAHNNLGNAFYESLNPEKAILSFQKAIFYNSKYEKAFFNLALVYKDLGDKESFIKNIEKVLKLNPHLGHAYFHLSQVKTFKHDDPQIQMMERSLQTKNLDSIHLIGFNFALAKVYDDLGNHQKQFMFLNEANRLRKDELNYSIEKDQKLFSRIKETFSVLPTALLRSDLKESTLKPIFIIGMPRSGTSLVHQIIGSHPAVKGLGELNSLNKFVVPLLKKFDKEVDESYSNFDLLSLREQYLSSLPLNDDANKIIIDKMPLNFRYVGFIFSAFPEAKIVHMKRDPIATCWSIFKSEFRGNAYSFDQTDISKYYALYVDMMDFWNELFPNQILNFSYEKLTNNQEKETRRLLDYCEIDWDDNCLDFYNNRTVVKTTSSMQVKQKMYQGSSEAWKKYEPYLHPLIKGLDYHLKN